MNLDDKTILIVDDTELYQTMITNVLNDLGINNILIAKDGLEGVRMARYYKPDLVLLDLEMPNIDGYESCKKIRLFANKITMPIIVISGKERGESLERVFDLGANDYFEKPFNAAEVGNRILFYLKYCETLQNLNALEEYIQHDLEIAKAVQRNTLPSPEEMRKALEKTGLDFYAFHQASIGLGGDIWNVYSLDSGDPVFILCDVSGHGINAAINSSFIVSTINSTFQLYKNLDVNMFSPEDFLDRLNFILAAHIQTGTFCAAACLAYNTQDNEIRYAGCGLPNFQRINLGTGERDFLSCKGLPIGISSNDLQPTSGTLNLGKEDLLLCMSDGLIESQTAEQIKAKKIYTDTMPGEDALSASIKTLCTKKQSAEDSCSAKTCLDSIIHDFETAEYILSSDDITLLAIRRAT